MGDFTYITSRALGRCGSLIVHTVNHTLPTHTQRHRKDFLIGVGGGGGGAQYVFAGHREWAWHKLKTCPSPPVPTPMIPEEIGHKKSNLGAGQ